MKKFTVFGHDACGFCKQAQKVLGESDLAYQYVNIHKEGISAADLEKTIGKPVKTVPQIFHGETYLGGFQELDQYLKALAA